MIRLLATVSWVVRWVTHSPRRMIGVLALPVLLGVALSAGPVRDRAPDGGADVLAGGRTATPLPTSATPPPSGLPGTTGAPPGPVASTRVEPVLLAEQVAVATRYVTTVNTHDARPGRDRGFQDAYHRAQPHVTPDLYGLISAESRRGDYLWAKWTARRAVVSVRVLGVGVPDGAAGPTESTAYVRVLFRQEVRPAGGAVETAESSLNLQLARHSDGRWLVARLLADT